MVRLRVLLAAGGTGGHIFPAIAIADEVKGRYPGAEILFVGTRREMGARLISQAGYRLKTITAWSLPRRLSLRTLIFPVVLVLGILQAAWIMLSYRPRVAIGTGGYASGPVLVTAWFLGIPVVIQEQNLLPGVTTRVLARIARQVNVSFEQSKKYLSSYHNLVVSGNPIRKEIGTVTKSKAQKKLDLDSSKKTLLVFGGSQGANRINQALLDALEELSRANNLQILWQTGKRDYLEVKGKMASVTLPILLWAFIEDMASALGAADLVIARSGATTIAELTKCGVPSILIPYPYATTGHQEQNARVLLEAGACCLILDKDLNGKRLAAIVTELLNNKRKLQQMAENSRRLARPKAAELIVDTMINNRLIQLNFPK
ncbi:MAG: undecaprenyldiphospho-muramoylpentapeptide beta-N-acetylglucosaminyltransferase [Candidatus Latescibacteria bacterium]|nr:undecaprenyldiphospho-muramoylpentapeptide beta-N-acetylglucosaminyltransferase [Candidatus Latescibacterota bacterium]